MTERTAQQIKALTPNEAWDIYVGSDSPSSYTHDDISSYVAGAPAGKDLDDDARDALEDKLRAMLR